MVSRKFWVEGPGSFLLAVSLALLVRWALVEAYVIPSPAMVPTLLVHDHIFVNKINFGLRVPLTEKWLWQWSDPGRGDVIVFKHPLDKKLFYVKRVVGVPGDKIFYEGSNLYVNDELIEKSVPQSLQADWGWVRNEDFPGELNSGGKDNYVQWEEKLGERIYSIILRKNSAAQLSFGPFYVPPAHFFVMGDNRDNSQDSRDWDPSAARAEGQVELTALQGEVKIPAGTIVRTDQPGTWSQRFVTQKDAIIGSTPIVVTVRAVEPGRFGNVAARSIVIVEGPLADRLKVTNNAAFEGGEDKRFVPRDLIVGRAVNVWLSCEKMLPVISFLCHPLHIRWGRFFHHVQ